MRKLQSMNDLKDYLSVYSIIGRTQRESLKIMENL
jgi:hypothetical protein